MNVPAEFSKISVVLVDDEPDPLEVMESLISKNIPELLIVGKAKTTKEAYSLICSQKPELVYLDIRLKSNTAFELLEQEFPQPFEVIFVTAFGHFALDAFRHHAISYILKPVDVNELIRATRRAITIIRQGQEKINGISHIPAKILGERVSISTGSEIEYLLPDEIVYAMADGSYCRIYLKDGSTRIISRNLKYLEAKLDGQGFFRPHRSYLVNSSYIKKWNKAEGGALILSDNNSVPVSKEGRTLLETLI